VTLALPQPGDRLHHIDGWRAIAILLVIIGHLSQYGWLSRSGTAELYATLGVLIFFFISGYVVSRSCLNEVGRTGSFSVRGFYIRRAFRIIPPLMLYLAACLALGHFGYIEFGLSAFTPSVLYLCNISIFECGAFSGHTWSLAYEEQFYLVFSVAFGCIELRRRPDLFVCLVICCIAAAPFLWAPVVPGRTGFILIYGLFAVGYAVAKHEPLTTLPSKANAALFLAATAMTFSIAMLPLDEGMVIARFYKFIYLVTIPVMIITSKNVIGRFLCTAPMVRLGQASYSIYLWQQLFMVSTLGALTVGQHILAMITALLGCLLLFELVERRLIGIGRRIAARRYQQSDG
jgi:peptidoglycan/LPS O-acetylase OafA/YrhL